MEPGLKFAGKAAEKVVSPRFASRSSCSLTAISPTGASWLASGIAV